MGIHCEYVHLVHESLRVVGTNLGAHAQPVAMELYLGKLDSQFIVQQL